MRGGEIEYESRKANRVYAAISEGCGWRGRVGSDVETGRKIGKLSKVEVEVW